MKSENKYGLAIACVFLWIGFVTAISFMEAWLKFRAPGITLPLGLGIGRLVFTALNKVELVLATAILVNLFKIQGLALSKNIPYLIPLAILIIQTFWILPVLDARAELIIQGQEVAASYFHIAYIAMEIIKVAVLIVLGIKLLNPDQ